MTKSPLIAVLKQPGGKELISEIFDLILRQKIARFMNLRTGTLRHFDLHIQEKLEALQKLLRQPLPLYDLKIEVVRFCLKIIGPEN